MKTFLILASAWLFTGFSFVHAQEKVAIENAFDFWVGQWKVSWNTTDGSTVEGTNTVEKILDGIVIQEHFVDPNNNFKGTSISVYNPNDSTWHQAWADNSGGYFDFYGEIDGDKRFFKTKPRMIQLKDKESPVEIVQRMVFYDIQDDSMKWDWESSTDGGKSWKLQWRINYEKKQSINE